MSTSPDPGTVSVEIDDLVLSYADRSGDPSPLPSSAYDSGTEAALTAAAAPPAAAQITSEATLPQGTSVSSQIISGVPEGPAVYPQPTAVASGITQGAVVSPSPNPGFGQHPARVDNPGPAGHYPARVQTPSLQEFAAASSSYEPLPEDFFRTIFYFSGMGRVIGSALNEGVHVDERQRDKAIDQDQLPPHLREQLHRDEYPLVISCRNQAHNLYNGLKNLHTLLDQVPTYTDSNRPVTYRPTSTEPVEPAVDDPIHGHRYFRDNRMRDSLGGESS